MKSILTITFLLFQFQIHAQPKFENDSNYQPYYLRKIVDSIFKIKVSNDFEFRYYMRHSSLFGGNASVITITQNNNQWSSHVYKLTFFPVEQFCEVKQKTNDLLSLWQMLEKERVLTLPDNSLLKDKNGEIAYSGTKDGTTYTFELTSRLARRSYSYYAPYGAIEEYPEIKEFTLVEQIIELLHKHFELKCN